ncbi:13973_t:CDS:2, partial [Cetraspora pellucida]
GSEEYNSNKSYFDSVKKKCNDYKNDVRNFGKARTKYKEKQRFVKIETENQVLKKELKQQKELLDQINNMEIQKRDLRYLSDEENKNAIEKYFNLEDPKFLRLSASIRGFKFEDKMLQYLSHVSSDAVIRRVPDKGIDLSGVFMHVKYIMQLKYHYKPDDHKVDVKVVREFYGAYNIYHEKKSDYVGIIVTNGYFTNDAKKTEAKNCNGKIHLYTHKELYGLFKKLNNKIIENINSNGSIQFENNDITNFSLNYSDNLKIYIYKLNNEYITCEKTSKKNEDVISNKLNQEFSFNPRFDDIQPIHDRYKLYEYFLNEFEFNILNKRKKDKLNKIELDEIINNFNLPTTNTIRTKITNLLLVKNQKYYDNIYNSKKRKFEHEIELFEHTRNKILKEINSENPHMTINVVEKIEITKRT